MNERTKRDLKELIINQEVMIESYTRMIDKAKDDELKDFFRSLQENHFEQMMMISDRVIELGDEPKFRTGFTGVMDEMRHKKSKENKITDFDLAQIALDGERLNAEKHASFQLGEVDPTSLEILQMTINADEQNIKELEEYVQHYEVQ